LAVVAVVFARKSKEKQGKEKRRSKMKRFYEMYKLAVDLAVEIRYAKRRRIFLVIGAIKKRL